MSSFQFFEACPHGGEPGSLVVNGIGFTGPSGSNEVPRHDGPYPCGWGEKNSKWCMKNKSHITKVMFLCAVARPHFNPCANSWWDGKLRIWPIGDWEPAKRASKN